MNLDVLSGFVSFFCHEGNKLWMVNKQRNTGYWSKSQSVKSAINIMVYIMPTHYLLTLFLFSDIHLFYSISMRLILLPLMNRLKNSVVISAHDQVKVIAAYNKQYKWPLQIK